MLQDPDVVTHDSGKVQEDVGTTMAEDQIVYSFSIQVGLGAIRSNSLHLDHKTYLVRLEELP